MLCSSPLLLIRLLLTTSTFLTFPCFRTLSHPRPPPHLPHHLRILHNKTPRSQDSLQGSHNALKTALSPLLLRETCDAEIGAAAAVEEGVHFHG